MQRKHDEEKRRWYQEKVNEFETKKAKEINLRQKILEDIIKLKGSKFVQFEIKGEKRKIENLKEHHLLEIDTSVLQEIKKKFEEDSKKTADDKYIKTFKRTDHIERERRNLEVNRIQ